MEVIRWTDFLEEYKDELEQETKSPGEGHGNRAMEDIFLRVIEHVCCVVSHSLFAYNSSSMVSSLASKWSHLGIFHGIGGLQVPSFRFKISEHCLSRCAARNIEQFFHLRMCRSSLSRIKNKCREHCYVITHIEVQNLLDKCQGQLYVWSPKVM